MNVNLTVLTVNFNTPEYVYALNKSLRKFSKWFNAPIEVVDNSIKKTFSAGKHKYWNVTYFNNELYNVLDSLPKSKYKQAGNYNSAHHALTVDWAIKNLVKTDYLLLVDSDIIFTSDIKPYYEDFVKNDYALYGFKRTAYKQATIAPWCCFINIKKIQELNLSYFDINRILYVHDNLTHDTGASLLEDFEKHHCKIKETPDNLFWIHFKGGSVDKTSGLKWLFKHKYIWN